MLCILLQLEQPHALYLAADADSEEMKCGKLHHTQESLCTTATINDMHTYNYMYY